MPASFTGSYSQNFDGLASSGSNISWTNDVTLPGWHLFRQPAASPVAIGTYNADTGASTSGAFVSYGSSASNDRALGGLASGGTYFGSAASGAVAGWVALALSNTTGSAIQGLTVSFNGEQWRNGGNATAQTMVLEYGYGSTFDQVATWVAPGASFSWTSPIATVSAAAVDGNNAGRVSNRGGSLDLSASPWAPATNLWLRWIENNDSGNDHGLAIDDLSISLPLPVTQPEVFIQAIDAIAAEYGDAATIRIGRTGSTAAALVVPISVVAGPGFASPDDLATPLPSSITIPAGSASQDLVLSLLDDSLEEGTETLRLQITAPSGTTLAASGASVDITLFDNDQISLISSVQGTGATSPLLDQGVTLRAVVVGDFQLSSELGGFFLQEESADWDTSALSSEGLYVAYPLSGSNVNVALGDRVLLSGLVGERFGQTAITSVGGLSVESQGRLGDTRRLDIPDLLGQRSASPDLEPYEGMWVRFPEALSVNGLFGQFRFGEIELSAGGLPQQPTNVMEPGPAAYAAEQATARRELVLDDGSNSSYRPASAATDAAPVHDQLLRRGDTISAVEGVLAYDFSKYRLHPTAPLNFRSENPRPAAPAAPAAGQIRLASLNVLNTFTTLNAGGALTDTGLAPRGANSAVELERQLSKLTAALVDLQADVIGLMELENDADDATLAAIVQRLNTAQPTGSNRAYSFVPTGLIGSDAIKVGLIYNHQAVAPSGAAQVLNSQAFVDPLASGTPKNRPALAQAFLELASGELVNVVVNHLKSKGATDATGADLDQLDGQAAFNATRTAAANQLLTWIASNPTGNNDRDWVILGDLNAYAQEDPIQVLQAAGYRNVLPTFTAEPPTSYAFFNPVDMSGALDHVLISPSLVPQATTALDWSINAAEGAFRNYNLDTNSNGNAAVRDFFVADPFRTSDHDPLLLDLDLGRTVPAGLVFAHGVASGDPYADSVILWTRITPPDNFTGLLDVQWEIATTPDFAPGSIRGSGSFSTSAARDWTVKVEAAGLSADTSYYFRFRSGTATSTVGQTKTLPVNSDPVRLAVFSCTNFPAAELFDAYARATAINSANPYDAWLHLGDYIYEYGPGGYGSAEAATSSRGFLPNQEIVSLDDYRQRYAQYHTDSGLQALRAAAPLIAIWDDHETANNSWSGGADNHQATTEGDWITRRDSALRAYHEWLPIREPGLRHASDGATALSPLTQGYRSFNFGDVLALHMLETRLSARDEQLQYPDQAAVQARIGAILADSTLALSYATRIGIAPPTSPDAIPAFANALVPIVSQELVIATVQQAWADPSRTMIGDSQLAWLQQQMATSQATWQVLGQQVLMQSMAVPAELLLNAGNPALLDKYAAPLQKLATGTPFTSLSADEQALFAEAGKIPYNLDAWDGYGVEREIILQSALALGKRLISLAGDTHNAWAGVLDTMSGGSQQPPGMMAGVEFGTPGVTSPGLERILPGADAYIRASYPAVDGLDGLFMGYVNGLKYADVNRRGFLDLTVSKEQAIGSFQFLNGTDPVSGKPVWSSETVVSSAGFALSSSTAAWPHISWQPNWRELDLNFGLAFDAAGAPLLLDPADYASVPRDGVQLADVRVQGSDGADRVVVGAGATVETGAGSDELDNTDSQGSNVLAGGFGTDLFLLRAVDDTVIGGNLLGNASGLGLPAVIGLVDGQRDLFLVDSSNPSPTGILRLLDFELGVDELLLDGIVPTGSWSTIRQQLKAIGLAVNAAPQLSFPLIALSAQPGVQVSRDLGDLVSDSDSNPLQLVKLEGPAWITTSGTIIHVTAPVGLSEDQLNAITVRLAFSDGQAMVPLAARLTLNAAPTALSLANTIATLAENTSTASSIKVADIAISDDALGVNTIALGGPDASSFEVIGSELFLKAGVKLNFEAKSGYSVSVAASDSSLPGSIPVSAAYTLALSDVNEAPTALSLANTIASLAENTSTVSPIKVADIVVSDDALGTNIITLGGPDSSSFEVIGSGLYLKAGVSLNFETKPAYSVSLAVSDSSLSGSQVFTADYKLAVADVNEPASALILANVLSELAATTPTDSRIKLADLLVQDDGLGVNQFKLGGADAGFFELEGSALYLKAGADIRRRSQTDLLVTLLVDDFALGVQPELELPFTLRIGDETGPRQPGEAVVLVPLSGGGSSAVRVRFAGGDLPVGGSVRLVGSLLPDLAGQLSLQQGGITSNGSGIALQLEVISGLDRASLNAPLELVAANLLAALRSGNGRVADRFLVYYGQNSAGQLSALTYDPIQEGGARFYDLSGDGVADFMSLTFVDGGYGDKDRVRNGQIDDPSFAGLVDLVPSLRRSSAAGAGLAGITVGDPDNATAPVALPLQARLQVQPGSANQIGYVVLDSAELATAEALLRDPAVLRSRAQLLFSSLESQDVVLPSGTQFSKDLLVRNGQSLHFFELIDAGLEEISGPADPRFRYLTPAELSTTSARFDSPAGIGFSLALRSTDQGLDALIGQEQHRAPLLDLTAFSPDQRVVGTVAIGREASLDSITGFYRTQDTSGAVRAADGRSLVRPGEVGYAQAALRMENQVADLAGLSVADNGTASRSFQLTGGSYLAPFSQVGGGTFFAFAAANTDGISHFRTLGSNTFGYEDLPGGGDRDFDDGVLSFRFDQVI